MSDLIRRLRTLLRRETPAAPVGDPTRAVSDHVYQMLDCLDRTGQLHNCTLGWADGPLRDVRVTVPSRDLLAVGQGVDLFEAFLEARRELEKNGLRIVCAGARLDCWPSGMARQMGSGETAYLLTPGKHAELEERVYLFARAEPEQVGTVREQQRAYRRWLDSLPEEEEA